MYKYLVLVLSTMILGACYENPNCHSTRLGPLANFQHVKKNGDKDPIRGQEVFVSSDISYCPKGQSIDDFKPRIKANRKKFWKPKQLTNAQNKPINRYRVNIKTPGSGYVKQNDLTLCWAACMVMTASQLDVQVTQNKVIEIAESADLLMSNEELFPNVEKVQENTYKVINSAKLPKLVDQLMKQESNKNFSIRQYTNHVPGVGGIFGIADQYFFGFADARQLCNSLRLNYPVLAALHFPESDFYHLVFLTGVEFSFFTHRVLHETNGFTEILHQVWYWDTALNKEVKVSGAEFRDRIATVMLIRPTKDK